MEQVLADVDFYVGSVVDFEVPFQLDRVGVMTRHDRELEATKASSRAHDGRETHVVAIGDLHRARTQRHDARAQASGPALLIGRAHLYDLGCDLDGPELSHLATGDGCGETVARDRVPGAGEQKCRPEDRGDSSRS